MGGFRIIRFFIATTPKCFRTYGRFCGITRKIHMGRDRKQKFRKSCIPFLPYPNISRAELLDSISSGTVEKMKHAYADVDFSCPGYHIYWIWRLWSNSRYGILLQYRAEGDACTYVYRGDRPGNSSRGSLPGNKHEGKTQGQFWDERVKTFQTGRRKGKHPLAGCHAWGEDAGTGRYPHINRIRPGKRLLWVFLRSSRFGSRFPGSDCTKPYGGWWKKDFTVKGL